MMVSKGSFDTVIVIDSNNLKQNKYFNKMFILDQINAASMRITFKTSKTFLKHD